MPKLFCVGSRCACVAGGAAGGALAGAAVACGPFGPEAAAGAAFAAPLAWPALNCPLLGVIGVAGAGASASGAASAGAAAEAAAAFFFCAAAYKIEILAFILSSFLGKDILTLLFALLDSFFLGAALGACDGVGGWGVPCWAGC